MLILSTRTKLEVLVILIVLLSSFVYGYRCGNSKKIIEYTGQYNFLDFELKEKKPQKAIVYKLINPDDIEDLRARASSPIVVTLLSKREGFFTHNIYGKADDGSKRTDFSYDAVITPNWKIVAGFTGIVFLAGGATYAYFH